MKRFKKICALFISSTLILSATAASLHSYAEKNESGIVFDDSSKISSELKELMDKASENELIPIYIFRRLIPNETIGELLLSEMGYDYKIYEDPDVYDEIIAPKIRKRIVDELGEEAAYKTDEKTQMSPIDRAISEDVDNYLREKRKIVKREYSAENNLFVERTLNKDRTITFCSNYSSTIITEATVKEIYKIAQSNDVENVMYFEDFEITPDLDYALPQVRADVTKGTGYNSGNGYKGSGIKVGIIEAAYGKYDENSPHLSGIAGSSLTYVDNELSDGTTLSSTVTDHATKVTSIIVGQSVTVNSHTYEGVVPLATVYQTSTHNSSDTLSAFEALVDCEVNVINYSGSADTDTYRPYDKSIDNLIYTTNVAFVVSAGNTGEDSTNVGSPSKALNAVTVGNADTKTAYDAERTTPPYPMKSTSSYEEPSYFPNKPDIVAPGTLISTAYSTTQITYGSGTSYSAPIVTGIIAQLMQHRPSYKAVPLVTKSIIMFYADDSKIVGGSSNGTVDNNRIREKSGVGMIDAVDSLKGFTLTKGTRKTAGNTKDIEISLTSGQKIKILLNFGKSNTSSISSYADMDNLDIKLLNPSGNQVKVSNSLRNNIEIIEYTATSTGTYTLRLVNTQVKNSTIGVPYAMIWKIS